jgi:hypothetical protein
MPAPLGHGDPPKESKPGEEPTLPTPQIQLEDDSQLITDLPKNHKSLPSGNGGMTQFSAQKESVWPPIPPELNPIDCVPCTVGLNLRLYREPETREIGYAHFDSDPKFCSALRVELNQGNCKMRAFLAKSHLETVAYYCGKLIAELLFCTHQTPVVAAVRAAILTELGRAPNERITESRFVAALAESSLLAQIALLPIYGNPVVGRSFGLGQLQIYIPTQDLGKPRDRSPSERKDPNHGWRNKL